ncbi:MAG: hypothetical protein WBE26_06155 [Phycisphaerae bacterium]
MCRLKWGNVICASALCALSVTEYAVPIQQNRGTPAWKAGQQWRLTVKQYYRDWMLDFSDQEMNITKNIPRVQYEYQITVVVASLEKLGNRTLARLDFIPGPNTPEYIGAHRYTLTIDTDDLRVIEAECTKGERVEIGKLTPQTVEMRSVVHKALFTQVLGFPVDWVIERGDMDRAGVECFLFRRPSEVGAKGHWEQVRPTDLDQETPQTYGSEFRRTVTPVEVGNGMKVIVSTRGSFQQKPTYEVEQVWDREMGWWRSFTRRRDGHLDLEATLLKE